MVEVTNGTTETTNGTSETTNNAAEVISSASEVTNGTTESTDSTTETTSDTTTNVSDGTTAGLKSAVIRTAGQETVYVYEPLALIKSCSIEVQQDTLETASPISDRWKEFVPSTLSWTLQTNSLTFANYSDVRVLLDAMANGTILHLRFFTKEALSKTDPLTGETTKYAFFSCHGDVLVEQATITGTVGSLTTVAATFRGVGELVIRN